MSEDWLPDFLPQRSAGPDLQAGSPLFMFWTELELPLGTFPQCLVLPRIVVFFSGGEVTNLGLSSRQADSVHKACGSCWAPAGEPFWG